MRKIIVTNEYELYTYKELSETAKEKVKSDYLEDRDEGFFTDMVNENTALMFPNSDLRVEYSFSYCQGDGLRFNGELNLLDILSLIKSRKPCSELMKDIEEFTETEIKTLEGYINEYNETLTIKNYRRYSFFDLSDYDFSDYILDYLESEGEDYDEELMYRFESATKKIMEKYCKGWENKGYEYFYEISDEDMNETSEANGWEYLADGTLYAA